MLKTCGKALAYGLTIAILVAGATGCKHKKGGELDTGTQVPTASGPSDGSLPNVDLENLLFGRADGLQTVYFDYDSSALRPDALSILSRNAEKIKEGFAKYPTATIIIQIAGHCDERGTQEYNLALGERRALAVREHLIKLGVPADRLITISYGEEMPVAVGSNEAAWSQNRRAEFNSATLR